MPVEGNKKAAVDFLHMVVHGDIAKAYKKHVDMAGKHHNYFFPAGFAQLQKAMVNNHKKFPVKYYTIKNVIGEGDIVAVHGLLSIGADKMVVVHIMRFEGGKIIEMWDCGQQVPRDSPNKEGPL